MDSVTRFCLALREIGLSAGEPPATRGYPPSVFAELPRLLERAGPGLQGPNGTAGQITALFTVLVEGDDHNEPVADAVRGILDGHVILDRRIAERGRYPAVDVLRSLSRAAASCLDAEESAMLRRARRILALYEDMADMLRLGAYRAGTDPAVDEAVALAPRIEDVLRQDKSERSPIGECFTLLRSALAGELTRGPQSAARCCCGCAASRWTRRAGRSPNGCGRRRRRQNAAPPSRPRSPARTALQGSQPAEGRTLRFLCRMVWDRTLGAQREAAAATQACVAATAEARALLNEARAGARALEAALEHVQDASRAAAARVEQQAVDEAAAGCKRVGGWSG